MLFRWLFKEEKKKNFKLFRIVYCILCLVNKKKLYLLDIVVFFVFLKKYFTYKINSPFCIFYSFFFLIKTIPASNIIFYKIINNIPLIKSRDKNGNIKNKWLYDDGSILYSVYCKKCYKYVKLNIICKLKSKIFIELYKTYKHVCINLVLNSKFSPTSLNKYFYLNTLHNFEFQFLRKNKIFNKGRYSRNRQNYRTGVFVCIYLSIVCIFGLYFTFFKFVFNFTYLWWFFIAFISSFIVPKLVKYRFYEPTKIYNKFLCIFFWVYAIFLGFLN